MTTERYRHQNLTRFEMEEVRDRLSEAEIGDVTGVWYDGNLVAIVLNDSSGIGSGIAALLNAITALHLARSPRVVPEPRDPTHVTQPPEESHGRGRDH